MRKIDIFIFICDVEKTNNLYYYKIIENKISLKDKKIIACINKVDLLNDGNKNIILTKFKEENKMFENDPIFLSAKTSTGIDKLKKLINEYSNDILKEKRKENESKNNNFSISLARKTSELSDTKENDDSKCFRSKSKC